MTTLSIFQPEITDLEAQINAFQQRLAELQQAETTGAELLTAITEALPKFEKLGGITKLKTAVLGLFGGTPDPTPGKDIHSPDPLEDVLPADNSEQPSFENFMTEVPPLQNPTTEEIFDAEVLPQPEEPKQLTIESAQADIEATPASSVEVAAALAEQMNYCERVQLTPTLAYQKKYDGEIVCAYLGCSTQKLAKDWAEQLELWGCGTEVRKAKRLETDGVKYEVKIQKIGSDRLEKLASYHSEPFQTIAAVSNVGKEPKKPQESTSPMTSSPNCDAAKDAHAAVPSSKPNDWQPKVGDRVRVAELIGEYKVASVGRKYVTVRRVTDDAMVSNILPTDCTPVLVDEPEIAFAFRQTGDAISPDYEVFWGTERLGKVWEHLTAGGWNHSLNRNPALSWRTREDAAFSLQLAFGNERDLHERTNSQLRRRLGLAS